MDSCTVSPRPVSFFSEGAPAAGVCDSRESHTPCSNLALSVVVFVLRAAGGIDPGRATADEAMEVDTSGDEEGDSRGTPREGGE